MVWIKTIEESEATGKLRQVYEEIVRTRGRIANVYKVHSLYADSIKPHLDLYLSLLYGKSELSRAEQEMIAVKVSSLNDCHYCVTHHSEALEKHTRVGFPQAFLQGKEHAHPKIQAMLDYAEKLTEVPSQISERDIHHLRLAGWSDEAILQINLITSYFNFVNRIVTGLGVELEKMEERTYKY